MKTRFIAAGLAIGMMLAVGAAGCRSAPPPAEPAKKPGATSAAQPAASAVPETPPAVTLQLARALPQGVTAQVQDVAVPISVRSRYQPVARLAAGEYQIWGIKKGGVLEEGATRYTPSADKKLVEVLVLFENHSDKEQTVDISGLTLATSGGNAEPWEVVPGATFENYAKLAERLRLARGAPTPDTREEIVHKLTVKGPLYCTLGPQQRTWLAAVFLVPRDVREARLAIQ
jgi:hypothetical protein